MNYDPEHLHQIAAYCEALDAVDANKTAPIFPRNGIVMTDGDGVIYGTLHDEVGGAWSFTPNAPELA